MKKNILLIVLLTFCLIPLSNQAQSKRNKKKKDTTNLVKTEAKKENSKEGIKSYDEIITKEAITDNGLFKVHKVGAKYYYEIPNTYLGKEMLLVSRIAKLPANLGGGYINAGTKTGERLIIWERFNEKILIKERSYNSVADEELPISISVKSNNYEPILHAFNIAAFSKDSTAIVVDVTKFYSSDVKAISGLSESLRTKYKVKKIDPSRSFINVIKSFPQNIEVIQDLTYDATNPPSAKSTQTISMQINQSMILLPETPMEPRFADQRVGWFTYSQVDYGSDKLKADKKTYIRRWKLEPKDPEAYAKGELVEPVKPIVYYIDPATPEALRKYIKEGVELWQGPFETAGFKNAIIAKDPPSKEENPGFSPEDIRYSVIRYVASETRNATGPSVSDPRSGEIIESDIIWYHNHLRSYRNRYLLETGAANPSARTLDTSAEDIGEMMKMVIAHEVGHALGLPHNMSASKAYNVESYRNGAFTQEFGIASTIMDYARYNYIAQPGDKNIRFIRKIGPYDHYAINWGYRKIPGAEAAEIEKPFLDQWIIEKAGDSKYVFGKQSSTFDPTSQTEDIGDNAIKASNYALKNLKIVAENLPEWTSSQTNDYNDLKELYGELLDCYNRYVGHVLENIGGVKENLITPSQTGITYLAVDKLTQQKSVEWLDENVFKTPLWLLDKTMLKNISYTDYTEHLRSLQSRFISKLLNSDRLNRIINQQSLDNTNYSLLEFMQEIRKDIFSEVYISKNVDVYRRNLQRTYIDRLAYLMSQDLKSDIKAITRGELNILKQQLTIAKSRGVNKMSKYHYSDLVKEIEHILDPKM
jgi:hypothetical protein